MGDEWPGPGRGVFQETFSLELQRIGKPFSPETPRLPWPQNCGQFSPMAALDELRTIARTLDVQYLFTARFQQLVSIGKSVTGSNCVVKTTKRRVFSDAIWWLSPI